MPVLVSPLSDFDSLARSNVLSPFRVSPPGAWSLLLIAGCHVASQLALLVNLIIQNYAIFIALHNWRHPELRMSKATWRMHVLSKGNAALAVLFLWTNSGILEVALIISGYTTVYSPRSTFAPDLGFSDTTRDDEQRDDIHPHGESLIELARFALPDNASRLLAVVQTQLLDYSSSTILSLWLTALEPSRNGKSPSNIPLSW